MAENTVGLFVVREKYCSLAEKNTIYKLLSLRHLLQGLASFSTFLNDLAGKAISYHDYVLPQ